METARENLLGKSIAELEQVFVGLGQKPYHGRQLFKWLYRTRQYDFSLMTDLTKDLRSTLAERFAFALPEIATEQTSADGTRKFLFRLADGNPVETVLIPDGDRKTVCISSQSGCALGCRFCATGTMGLLRHLTAGEIIGQLIVLRDRFGERAFSNVVFMGMGEPLQNFRPLLTALEIMSDPLGLQIAAKKITVSTSGITPKIRKLADSGLKPRLALSLHAAT
ncbi:MAG: 23S rRNA (adenine(2503)-C(2))-methyltransferase RlmN, partial [Candidatus Zixiibacteriota bacterium]